MIPDIWKNPLTATLHAQARRRLKVSFPLLDTCSHHSYLSLAAFLDRAPERFYCRKAFSSYLRFLRSERIGVPSQRVSLFDSCQHELDKALLYLSELNRHTWHDLAYSWEEYEFMRFADSVLHPAYLKLLEGVLRPFLYLAAVVSRRARGKSAEGLDLYNCVRELKEPQYRPLTSCYDNIVRNGIAHGAVTFKHDEVEFRDRRENSRVLSHRQILELVDNTIDTANGCALAFRLFCITQPENTVSVPRQVLLEELKAHTESPWWTIEGYVPSEMSGCSQLVIHARPRTRDYLKVQHSAFMTAVLAELFAPGFDRYFLSLRSRYALPGWAAFDGQRLQDCRRQGVESIEMYKGVLENNLIMYLPRLKLPRFFHKIAMLVHSIRINLPLTLRDMRKSLGRIEFIVRDVSIHRNGWRTVLGGSVVLSEQHETAGLVQDSIRQQWKRIIRGAHRAARRRTSITDISRYLPLGFARVRVFASDHRMRRLSNYGLGSDLVGTVQVKDIGRMRVPDIIGAKIEQKGRCRLAWNKAWLDAARQDGAPE